MKFCVYSLALFFLSTATANAGVVKIRSKSEVEHLNVTLGDIAELEGFPQEERKRLERLELGRAPQIGQRRIIPRAFIRNRVQRALPPGSTIRLGKQTEIRRKGKNLEGHLLREKVKAAVEHRLGDGMLDVAHLEVPVQGKIRIPESATVEIRFEERQPSDSALTVAIFVVDGDEDKLIRRTVVELDTFTEVITLNHDGRRGNVIREGDLIVNRVPRSQVPRRAIRDLREAVGGVLKRSVKRGETLQDNWLEVPPLVLRGQRVRLIATRGTIKLSTMGEALSKGKSQELIRVRNLSSKKIVTGRVTPNGNVEMEF